MQAIKCEMCGGSDIIKKGGVFICESCGCKYSTDEAKKLMVQISAPVKVEGIQNGNDLFENISSFIRIGDYKSAKANIEKMKSTYPDNYKTWIASIELAIHQMNSGKDVDIIEQEYLHLIEEDVEKALVLCAAEKHIIQERFDNFYALVEENKKKKAKQKEKLFKDFEKGDYRSIHNFYYKRSLSYAENMMNQNLFIDGYVYIFKFENNKFYLLTYSIKDTIRGTGSSCNVTTEVHIGKNGKVMAGKTPLYIDGKECRINDIVFKNGYIEKIIMPGCEFVQEPEISVQDENVPKSGCYIATCVYGSYDCPEVWTLRRYRDCTLSETWYGRAFIRAYYLISPTVVKRFGHTEWFKKIWRGKLDRMVAELQAKGVDSTPYKDKTL